MNKEAFPHDWMNLVSDKGVSKEKRLVGAE